MICDSDVLTKLFESYCLSLYGAPLWKLGSPQLKSLEVSFNNILRKIWRLPRNCHTRILHLVANLPGFVNKTVLKTVLFIRRVCSSFSPLISHVFSSCFSLVYTFTGFNQLYHQNFVKHYNVQDYECASYVWKLCLFPSLFDINNHTINDVIHTVCCS